jgi:hypothetical protein
VIGEEVGHVRGDGEGSGSGGGRRRPDDHAASSATDF